MSAPLEIYRKEKETMYTDVRVYKVNLNDAVLSIESVGPLCRHRAKTKHQAKTKKVFSYFVIIV